MFVGSEGTLGVITQITLKINPKPTSVETGLAWFSRLSDAGYAVSDIMHSGIIPSALEILDDNTIKVLREHGKMNLPDATAIILVETDGYTDTETAFQMGKISEVFRKNAAVGIRVANSPEEVNEFWQTRKLIGSIAAQLRNSNVSEDVAVPISKVPDLLTGISMIVRNSGLPFVIFGHAGDGNLHPRIMFDRSDPDQTERVNKAVDAIFRLTCELKGTLTGEHGIGLAKAPYLKLEHGPVAVEMMRAIKRLFDPNNILNPGKMNLESSDGS